MSASYIDQKTIEEFKRIYEAEFKQKLSNEEASILANQLLELYSALYVPPEKEEDSGQGRLFTD